MGKRTDGLADNERLPASSLHIIDKSKYEVHIINIFLLFDDIKHFCPTEGGH